MVTRRRTELYDKYSTAVRTAFGPLTIAPPGDPRQYCRTVTCRNLPEPGPGDGSPHVDPVLLDYAQRLSEEIVARAVQQWAELDGRYGDIPYIECDVP
ncbi:hypothetical protein Z043_125973 [Scleropages formosus]|uniref:Small membrane A-kinase anchor protein n=1 Tax=Scleropages formosus TaxID=113540 RepID=A0A0P7W1C6_SCLFO|nr:hypothetical protein Z043_125973 [Scleropages formosus]